MLTFVGLGLYDKTDVSEKGLACIRNADHVISNAIPHVSWARR